MPAVPPPKRQVAARRKAPTPTKRSESQMASAYEKVWRSPFVRDTLGVPSGVGMMALPMDSDAFAEYSPADRTISANIRRDPAMYPMAGASPADSPSERSIMAHEIGHAYGKAAFPSLKAPMLAPAPSGKMTPREADARMALSEYGQTSPDEALAQAYTNAVSFLSETAPDTTGFRQKMGEYEGNTPGMGAMVRDLLRAKPIYQKHPLRSVIR